MLSKQEIKENSEKAVANMKRVLKAMTNMQLGDWGRFGFAIRKPFVPNKNRQQRKEFLKKERKK